MIGVFAVKASTFQKSNPTTCLATVLKEASNVAPELNNSAQAKNGQQVLSAFPPEENENLTPPGEHWQLAVYRMVWEKRLVYSEKHEMTGQPGA